MTKFRKAYVLLTHQLGPHHALELAISQSETVEAVGTDPIFEGVCEKLGVCYKCVSADTANYHPISVLMDQAWDWVDKETDILADHYMAQNKFPNMTEAITAAVVDMRDTVGLYVDGRDVVSFP